jgi:hypothetical protein
MEQAVHAHDLARPRSGPARKPSFSPAGWVSRPPPPLRRLRRGSRQSATAPRFKASRSNYWLPRPAPSGRLVRAPPHES